MTDPLAVALHQATRGFLEHDVADPAFCDDVARIIRADLAAQGVVLVDAESLAAALGEANIIQWTASGATVTYSVMATRVLAAIKEPQPRRASDE